MRSPQIYNPRIDTFTSRITINPEKRFGKQCVRNTRIAVGDVLGWLASGMTFEEILLDFDQLTREDIFEGRQGQVLRRTTGSGLAK